jgi:hypothetical protein
LLFQRDVGDKARVYDEDFAHKRYTPDLEYDGELLQPCDLLRRKLFRQLPKLVIISTVRVRLLVEKIGALVFVVGRSGEGSFAL